MKKYTIVIALTGRFIQTVKEAHNRAQAIDKVLESLWGSDVNSIVSITITEEIEIK